MLSSNIDSAAVVNAMTLTPEQIKFYKDEGYLLIRGLLPTDAAAALNREVLEIMDLIGLPMTKLKQTSEYLEGSALDAFINSVRLKSVAEQLMEGPSSVYLPFTAVKTGGGGGRFQFHQDNQYTRLDAPACNLWCALAPMRAENGCLQVVPRSHLNGTLEAIPTADGDRTVPHEPHEFLTVDMEAGDCLAFSRLTVHGSGQNITSEPRVGYAVQFHRNDARWLDRENHDWKLLTEHPRWKCAPVKVISVPRSKTDGH
jgi:ectoine hydroxylase-related dioxygenase (phytanoyl-CoA dioxygenase family)